MTPRWTLVGSVGGPGFGAVDPAGRVTAAGASWSIEWWVGADDGWHFPAEEASTRQRVVPGVVETRVKVPAGDAVHRVYGVGGAGDLVTIEVENDSPLPFGVAFGLNGEPPMILPREPFPLADPPRPAESACQLPVAHRTTMHVAVALAGPAPTAMDPDRLPSAEQAVRAWQRHLATGMRIDVPDPVLMSAVDAARAGLLLFDDGVAPRPAPFTGGRPEDAVALVAALEQWGLTQLAVELGPAVSRRHRRRHAPEGLAAHEAVARVDTMLREASPTFAWDRDGEGHHGGRTAEFLLAVRDMLLTETLDGAALLPWMPPSWVGAPVEVHGARAGGALVSFGVRWHGDRPALMWEIEGAPLRLTAPALDVGWATDESRGEALLVAHQGARS